MSIFKQKRQSDRKSLIYYLEISDTGSDRMVGRIVDITIGGFQLICDEPSDVGKAYQLKIQLPEEIQGTAEVLVETRCVRSEQDRHSRYYYSGFQFKEISSSNASIIEKLISQYEF